jgi:hypothetical protein
MQNPAMSFMAILTQGFGSRHQDGAYIICLLPSPWLSLSAFYQLSRWAYSSTLKMETIYFSEASVDYQRITRRFILETELFMKVSIHSSSSVPNRDKWNSQTANSVSSAYINISM